MQRRGTLLLAAVLAVIAFGYLWATRLLPVPPFGGPVTARAFPTILGVGMLIGAVLLVFEPRAAAVPAEQDGGAQPSGRQGALIPALIAGWTLLYVTVLESAGFIPATAGFLLGLMLFFHRQRQGQAIGAALGFTVGAYLLFVHALGVALPAGLLATLVRP